MTYRALSTAVVLLVLVSVSHASAGEVTVPMTIVADTNSGNAAIPSIAFINPNNLSVDLKFVVLVKDSSTCAGSGTPPSCSGPPPGQIDQLVANADGLQTVTIPARGKFSISGTDLGASLEQIGDTPLEIGEVVVQASWPDDVQSSDGSLRKITPIKTAVLIGNVHLDAGSPDALNSISTTPF